MDVAPAKVKPKAKPKAKPKVKSAITKVGLTKIQKQIIDLGKESAVSSEVADFLAKNYSKVRDMKLSPKDVIKLSGQLSKKTKLRINAPLYDEDSKAFKGLFKGGAFKNQFQLGKGVTSQGKLSPFVGGDRDVWEKNFSAGIFHDNKAYKKQKKGGYFDKKVADERPVYGYVSDQGSGTGPAMDGIYGETSFELKPHVYDRSTMFFSNTSSFQPNNVHHTLMNKNNNDRMVDNLLSNEDVSNSELMKIIAGKKDPVGFTGMQELYVEAQVYGGVDLTKDVSAIFVKNLKKVPAHIKKLAKKYNIPLKESVRW